MTAYHKPFFSILSFQAVHSPLQAPNPNIDKYDARYIEGWERVRSERYQRQVQMGLVPAGLKLPESVLGKRWDSLSPEDQRLYAKKMAVFAGMLDSADENIGRLRDYLRNTGQLDHTVFIVMSDNGADSYELNNLNLPFKLWYMANYSLGYERLGQPGTYAHYSQDWAEVSNTPFAMFKGTSGEGGMRVPFILSYPQRVKPGRITNQFAYATDFLPTILDIGGVPLPGEVYHGKKLYRPTGTSLLPYLEGKTPAIHDEQHLQGFEGTGGEAMFKGDYKITRNAPPYGDNQWHLFNVTQDPTESRDLSLAQPLIKQELQQEYKSYLSANGVILPPADYVATRQVLLNNWPILLWQLTKALGLYVIAAIAAAGLLIFGFRSWRRKA